MHCNNYSIVNNTVNNYFIKFLFYTLSLNIINEKQYFVIIIEKKRKKEKHSNIHVYLHHKPTK